MFKLAAAVLDFYDDPEFHRESSASELFGGVLISPEQVHHLKDKDFAIKIATAAGEHRKFPIYNRPSTAISGQYFDRIEGELPDEIRKVAGYFLKRAHRDNNLPIPPCLQHDFETPESHTVVFSPEGFAEVANHEGVVKIAERSFMDMHGSLTSMEKVMKAVEIDEISKEAGVLISEQEVWDYVPKDQFGPNFRLALEDREKTVADDPMLKEAFAKVLEEMKDLPVKEMPFLIHEFDKVARFHERYNRSVMDPFYAAWGGFPLKEAGMKEDVDLYKLQTVGRHRTMLENILGENLAAKFTRDPKGCYAEMSPDQKNVIDTLKDTVAVGKDMREASQIANDLKKKTQKNAKKPSEEPKNTQSSASKDIHDGL